MLDNLNIISQIVKCKNIECCFPFRWGLQLILKNMFLPPPILVMQTAASLKWAKNDAWGISYLILCQKLTMKDALEPAFLRWNYLKRVPYDYSNPVVEGYVIKNITCSYCQLYFGAVNSKEAHQKFCKTRPKSVPITVQDKQTTDVPETCEAERPIRIWPSRIKARRGVELLCSMEMHNLGWYDMIEFDVNGLDVPDDCVLQHGTTFLENRGPIWSEESDQ